MAYTDIELILHVFAKEYGWDINHIMNMQYRHYRMYLRELIEQCKANECASKNKKYVRPKKAVKVGEVGMDVKELARRLTEEKYANRLRDDGD